MHLVRVAHAASNAAVQTILQPIIDNVAKPIIGLMFAVAVFVFIYGVLQLVFFGGDEERQGAGKRSIMYGVIGMFIMVSAWGIIYFVSNTLKGIF